MPEAYFDLIVPVFNEVESLPDFFSRLQKLGLSANIIFIDNGSTDGSLALLKQYPGAQVIAHEHNEGYGASIVDGIRAGKHQNIVIIDADGEYPLECIPALLIALETQDVVYGSRFLAGQGSSMPWLKARGNQLISEAFNRLFQQQVTDLYTGCKAFRRSCLQKIQLQQTGFEHVLELSAKLAARQYRIHEIPLVYTPRQAGRSKMRHGIETAKFFYWLLQYAHRMKAGRL
jgi:glycosyltransferase involved in cell wall biosynthesis